MVWLADEMIGSAIRLDNGHSIGYNDCSEATTSRKDDYLLWDSTAGLYC
jgi:hypothetical protein